MARKNLTLEANDRKVVALRHVKLAAAMLNERSEALRSAIDNLDTALNGLTTAEISFPEWQRVNARLQSIRERRNGMECFQLECLVKQSVETVWKELS